MTELKAGTKCWIYEGELLKPKKAFIIGKVDSTKYLYTVLIEDKKEPKYVLKDYIFTEKENLLDKIEEDIDYMEHILKEFKKEIL